MEILTRLTDYLQRSRINIGAESLFIVESSGGVVLASTAEEDKKFDIEALGSLAGGSVAALEQLITFFNASSLSSLTVEADSKKLLLVRAKGPFFLLVATPASTKTGYLKLKIDKILPEINQILQEFEDINREGGSLDREKLSKDIENQLDTLFDDI